MDGLIENGVTQEQLDMAIVKLRSSFYDELGYFFGVGRADLLCCFALFDDDPTMINRLEEEFLKVDVALVNKTIQEYLVPTNRTVLYSNPLAGQENQ